MAVTAQELLEALEGRGPLRGSGRTNRMVDAACKAAEAGDIVAIVTTANSKKYIEELLHRGHQYHCNDSYTRLPAWYPYSPVTSDTRYGLGYIVVVPDIRYLGNDLRPDPRDDVSPVQITRFYDHFWIEEQHGDILRDWIKANMVDQ